jgi:cobalt-zinc-cadmium resistance protein CzcA
VNTAFAGQSTGLVYEGEKRFDLIVRMDNEQRKDISDVQNLLVPTIYGTQIPLSQVADIQIKDGPNQIQREDAKRRIIVGFNVRKRDVQSIVNELQEKVKMQIKFPANYYITFGGSFENLTAAKKRLGIAVPVSLLLILLLLFFAFGSIKHSLLIYSAIPLSAIGGIFALSLRGLPFSISAGVGFIALFGVAVLNGIVLIAEFNRLKAEGILELKAIVLKGTKLRLRPVLMTALVASLGFLPMALSNGAGAEVQRPLATVVIGGLLVATLLTLLVLPILYILFETISLKRNISKATYVFIGFLLISNYSNAQNTISLQASIDSALSNNLNVKNEKLKADYQKKLISTGANIPQTMLNAEYGQINSIYTDTRFGIVQNLNFPTVYSYQKSALKSLWKSSNISVSLKEVELKKQVRQAFYSYLYLLQKQKLLQSNDSMYIGFLTKATARFKSGESNVLEHTTAENQRAQISIQLNQLNTDMELLLMQFQLLLNTSISYIPNDDNFKMDNLKTDSNSTMNHPSIQLLQQQKQYSLVNTRLEKSRLLPELTIAYSNMSVKGMGADNIDYGYEKRFQSAQIGLGIPLFFKSFSAKIGATKLEQLMAENRLKTETNMMNAEWNKTNAQYSNYLKTITIYESKTLNNAQLIIETANKQFANGDINYIEWVMLTNQAISIKNEYLNGVYNLNETIIQLNYLNNK